MGFETIDEMDKKGITIKNFDFVPMGFETWQKSQSRYIALILTLSLWDLKRDIVYIF